MALSKWQASHWRSRYGLEFAQVAELLKLQDDGCAICAVPLNLEISKSCHIDHCHASKKIRGVLCSSCNRALGLFRDSVQVLENAVSYLKEDFPVLSVVAKSRRRRRRAVKHSSKYIGVSWSKARSLWTAQLRMGKTVRHLGAFVSEQTAALEYDRAARQAFGEEAQVNFRNIRVATDCTT
jgi:hypothetical protein